MSWAIRWLDVYDKHCARNLDKVMGHKSLSNAGDMLRKERVEICIGDVPCGHEQELVGHTLDGERIDKISVFGYDNGLFPQGNGLNLSIEGAITPRQVECMDGFMPPCM